MNLKLSFFSRICQKYEEISETIRGIPETTEELVSLIQFIKETKDMTVHKLIDEIDEASYRLSFLLDYAILPCKWNLSWYLQLQPPEMAVIGLGFSETKYLSLGLLMHQCWNKAITFFYFSPVSSFLL